MKLVASPMHLSQSPVQYNMPPPMLGQHTREVLQEHLMLDSKAIEKLYDKGVL